MGHLEEGLILVELHALAPPLFVLGLLPRHYVLGELVGRRLANGHRHVYSVGLEQHLQDVQSLVVNSIEYGVPLGSVIDRGFGGRRVVRRLKW